MQSLQGYRGATHQATVVAQLYRHGQGCHPGRSLLLSLDLLLSFSLHLPSSSPGGKVGSHEADTSHARQDLVPLAGEQQRLVHLPPALVGPSDPRLLRDLHRPQLASRRRKKNSLFISILLTSFFSAERGRVLDKVSVCVIVYIL